MRLGFFSVATLATTELIGAFAPFFRVTRSSGFGETVKLPYTKAEILERFRAGDDDPILFAQWRFFLIHAPGGIAAAYRKCTHLGCAVPFSRAEDQFHCPCHHSIYDKRTAIVIDGPAPRGLDLFHVREEDGRLLVDANPLDVLVRDDNKWNDAHLEVRV